MVTLDISMDHHRVLNGRGLPFYLGRLVDELTRSYTAILCAAV